MCNKSEARMGPVISFRCDTESQCDAIYPHLLCICKDHVCECPPQTYKTNFLLAPNFSS